MFYVMPDNYHWVYLTSETQSIVTKDEEPSHLFHIADGDTLKPERCQLETRYSLYTYQVFRCFQPLGYHQVEGLSVAE